MSRVQSVRALVEQRLRAAAEEIFVLFERTIAEYEEELCRSKEENERNRGEAHRLKPEVNGADVYKCIVRKEEVPPEQQDWSSSLEQEDPEPPHIKEEPEEVWTSQEGGQLQGLEEADITKFPFTPVPVKSEDDEEEPQSSQLHQRHTEQTETGADGEDCGGPEPDRNSDPDVDYKTLEFSVAEIEVSCEDWEEPREREKGDEDPISEMSCGSPEKPLSCSECRKQFTKNRFLETHMRAHTGEKPFSCSVCGKKYTKKGYLIQHLSVHRGERRLSCRVCHKRLVWLSGVECHQCASPAGGKSECDKRLCYSHHLKKDLGPNTEETWFSCSVCGRKFTQRGYLIQHMARHTGKIRFRCCVCDKRFVWRHELKNHKCVAESSQTEPAADGDDCGGSDSDDKTSDSSGPETEVREENWTETRVPQSGLNPVPDVVKSFICAECGKTFNGEENLKIHMRTHAGEKPFSCSFCEKGFTQRGYLTNHMTVHTEEKHFLYCVCGKRFAWRYNLKNHKCAGDSSQSHERNREAEPPAGSPISDSPKLQTGADDHKETRESPFNLNSLKKNQVLEGDAAERPFSCSQCAKRFRRKKNLQEHLRIHTGEKPYGCSVCMKYFSCSGSLRKHLRIHTGERPFSCSVCGNRFTESGHLKVHMRTHTGEKPFSCSVCGKSFTWRQSFNNHMKYHTETRE